MGIDETKNPVKMSPRAVLAWQEKQQLQLQQQQLQTTPNTNERNNNNNTTTTKSSNRRDDYLRSPFELSSVSSPDQSFDSSGQIKPKAKAGGEDRKKPPRTQLRYGGGKPLDDTTTEVHPVIVLKSEPLSTKNQYQLPSTVGGGVSATTITSRSTPVATPPPPPPPPPPVPPQVAADVSRTNSWRKKHDHDSFKDRMIRNVVLQQNHSLSSSDDSAVKAERLGGHLFLQVHSRDAISPRSSLADDDDDDEETDSLYTTSDIFSDHHLGAAFADTATSMDSAARERYILACRLLRTRMTQPQPAPPIMPMERELLEDLLDRFRNSDAAGSQVAHEALAKILDDDKVQNSFAANDDMEEPKNVVCSRSRSNASSSNAAIPLDTSLEEDLTVASIHEEETGFNTVLKHHGHKQQQQQQQQQQHQQQQHTYPRSQSWKDEKSSKMTPLLAVEGDDDKLSSASLKLPMEVVSSSMVRLDGWDIDRREQYPFEIMGLDANTPPESRVLTPALMESLRGFFPFAVSEDNFWLKFSLARDGASLRSLLLKCMASQHTILAIETDDGSVFGSFCSSPWQNHDKQKWFGSGEAFLWRLKQSRYIDDSQAATGNRRRHVPSNEMEVYPFTGSDDMVQYCTSSTIAVGGGSWQDIACPYDGEPTGIGLMIDGDLEGGETNSCATFANPRLYGRFKKGNEFTIQNLEIWTLTPCDSIPLAEQLERRKYFIKENTQPSPSPRRYQLPPL